VTTLTLELERSGAWYRPGETVSGSCAWRLEDDAASLTVHLLWFTEGKGTQDVAVLASERVERPETAGRRSFSLELPVNAPYSFSGTLISLSWAVEAVVEPGGVTERVAILVGPRPSEVRLAPVDDQPVPG
jgi:hypothetical protein